MKVSFSYSVFYLPFISSTRPSPYFAYVFGFPPHFHLFFVFSWHSNSLSPLYYVVYRFPLIIYLFIPFSSSLCSLSNAQFLHFLNYYLLLSPLFVSFFPPFSFIFLPGQYIRVLGFLFWFRLHYFYNITGDKSTAIEYHRTIEY